MRARYLMVLALCLAAAGCTDSTTAPPQVSAPPKTSAWVGSVEYDQADPPTEWPVKINSVSVVATLPAYAPGDATISAEMNYDAYHASIEGSATVLGKDNSTRTFPSITKHANLHFRNQTFRQSYTLPVLSACGNALEAQFKFRAWLVGPTGLGALGTLDSEERIRGDTDYQPECVPAPATGGGGSGDPPGGGSCYTVRTDHYWYYLDNGEMQFRYSSYDTYCESSY